MRRTIALGVLVLPLCALAGPVYMWLDARGQKHFSDDPSVAPPDAGVVVLLDEGEATGPAAASSPGAEAGPAGQTSEKEAERARRAAEREAEIARRLAAEEAEKVRRAESETQWRTAFRQAHRRIAELEASIQRDRKHLASAGVSETGRTTVRTCEYPFGCTPDVLELTQQRLARSRDELIQANLDLEALERDASFKAVPREWRGP